MTRRIFPRSIEVDDVRDFAYLLAPELTMIQVLEIANGLRPLEEICPMYVRKIRGRNDLQ